MDQVLIGFLGGALVVGIGAYFLARRRSSEVVEHAGQIGLSKVVYDNIKNKDGFSATYAGERDLKNVATPVGLYILNA